MGQAAGKLHNMAQTKPEMTFEPEPRRIGLEWRVIATYPGGQKEHITGFANEAEAMQWLASNVSGALSPSCSVRSNPEDVARLDWIGSHIWLTI